MPSKPKPSSPTSTPPLSSSAPSSSSLHPYTRARVNSASATTSIPIPSPGVSLARVTSAPLAPSLSRLTSSSSSSSSTPTSTPSTIAAVLPPGTPRAMSVSKPSSPPAKGSRSPSRSPGRISRSGNGTRRMDSSSPRQPHNNNSSSTAKVQDKGKDTPLGGTPSSWWGWHDWTKDEDERHARPWQVPGEVVASETLVFGKTTTRATSTVTTAVTLSVPSEQTQGWIQTRARVAQAAVSILGNVGDVAHELLSVGADALQFAPVAGLSQAAKVLLSVWDALQLVDTNRMACLRLTERCANILLSVREEIHEAGDEVAVELTDPIATLVQALHDVQAFLIKQVHRPFLKRYLKRDEILKEIQGCDAKLCEVLARFSLSIQIRILKKVQAADTKREMDQQELLKAIREGKTTSSASTTVQILPPLDHSALPALQTFPDVTPSTTSTTSPKRASALAIPAQAPLTHSRVSGALHALRTHENALDAARDMADLRSLLCIALQAPNDSDMIAVLQVGREEMPEAIKALQRALEREAKIAAAATADAAGVSAAQRVSVRVSGLPRPERKGTVGSVASVGSSSGGSGSAKDGARRRNDMLDREFMEMGIDALRRISLSRGMKVGELPSWTITRYEVDREEKIGIGFFSDVYRGKWRQRIVAIKVLAASTPRSLFVHEVAIWKTLNHPNVLELYGASSASGEPPWFFVCRFCEGGNLSRYLRDVDEEVWSAAVGANGNGGVALIGGERKGRGLDLLKMMLEVAKGMEYLHSNGVLHGDLKGANVLVDLTDGKRRCVVADFGQSEMKSEAYRLSGTPPPPHGTLRWQAPELMSGHTNKLSVEVDVYAFAIVCVEILTKGALPWNMMDDGTVRHFVLKENTRPGLPQTRINTPALTNLISAAWHADPFQRPAFSKIVSDLKLLRRSAGMNTEESPRPRMPSIHEYDEFPVEHSPSLQPADLPGPGETATTGSPVEIDPSLTTSSSESYRTADGGEGSNSSAGIGISISKSPDGPSYIVPSQHTQFSVTGASKVQIPQTVPYASSINPSTIFVSESESGSEDGGHDLDSLYDEGYESPMPADENVVEAMNERRYRLLLSHEFHPTLTLPLWTPTPVVLGAVGYLLKPAGRFLTLFSMFEPSKTSDNVLKGMPSVYGYGKVTMGSLRQDKRSVAQRGLDAIQRSLPFKSKNDIQRQVSRRYSFPLRSGHKSAHLYVESTMYRYLENLDASKKWFKANVEAIIQAYGVMHGIQKEDLFLVVGTLNTPNYALFISHKHPDAQAHFDVYSHSTSNNQEWGKFTIDTDLADVEGPVYHEAVLGQSVSANKVSRVGEQWDTVLLARLRFRPDVPEPTSL